MWYRLSQNLPEDRKSGGEIEMEWKSGLGKIKDLQDKIKTSLEKIDPDKKDKFQSEYDLLFGSYNQTADYRTSFQPLQKLYSDINSQIKMQQIQAEDYIKSIVNKRIVSIGGYDADKLFKDYLEFQNIDNLISAVGTGEDLIQIAKFFLSNATNPKFNIVKNIINRMPVSKWSLDIVTLLMCFYLNSKLEELIDLLKNRKPFTFKDDIAIQMLQSKLALNAIKIGISLNNILNKNPLGQLVGQIGSVGVQGVEGLQSLMGTDKSIQDLIKGN